MFSRISRTIPRGYSLPTLSLSFSRISRSKENRRRAKERKKSLWKEYLLIENNRDYLRFITVAGEQRLDAWSIFHGMTRPRMDSYLFDNRHKLFPSLLLVWIIHDANVPLLVGGKSGDGEDWRPMKVGDHFEILYRGKRRLFTSRFIVVHQQ